jgi:hypothetical protein
VQDVEVTPHPVLRTGIEQHAAALQLLPENDRRYFMESVSPIICQPRPISVGGLGDEIHIAPIICVAATKTAREKKAANDLVPAERVMAPISSCWSMLLAPIGVGEHAQAHTASGPRL